MDWVAPSGKAKPSQHEAMQRREREGDGCAVHVHVRVRVREGERVPPIWPDAMRGSGYTCRRGVR